nr:hypothetical protein [uncultured Psychroserpens sp.]
MKNILKLTTLLFLSIFIGCNDDDSSSRFSNDPSQGWVQFQDATTNVALSFDDALELRVYMGVPLNETDLNISYNLVSISGLDPNTVFNQNNLNVPANTGGQALVGGYPTISFDLDLVQNIVEPMIFDVVMQSTDRSSVSVGIAGSGRPTTNRVTICPSTSTGAGTFLGDYVLTVPTGDGPFGPQFENGVTVTLLPGSGENGLSRVFQVDYLPGIGAGLPVIDIEFTFTAGGVVVGDNIQTGLGCGSTFGGIELGNDDSSVAALPCSDDVFTLNLLDFKFSGDPEDAADDTGTGGCGQEDVATTILLTKV